MIHRVGRYNHRASRSTNIPLELSANSPPLTAAITPSPIPHHHIPFILFMPAVGQSPQSAPRSQPFCSQLIVDRNHCPPPPGITTPSTTSICLAGVRHASSPSLQPPSSALQLPPSLHLLLLFHVRQQRINPRRRRILLLLRCFLSSLGVLVHLDSHLDVLPSKFACF